LRPFGKARYVIRAKDCSGKPTATFWERGLVTESLTP